MLVRVDTAMAGLRSDCAAALVRIASGWPRTSRARFGARPSFAVGHVESESRNGSAGVLRLRTFGDRC